MKKRSAVSLNILDGQNNDSGSQLRHSDNGETFLCSVLEELKSIKKQLKQKVNRSEFMSSLSTKVSLSELGSWSYAENSSKENSCPNRYNGHTQEAYNKMQDQIDALVAEIKQNKNKQFLHEIEVLRETQELMETKYEQFIEILQQKLDRAEQQYKLRLGEVEAYIYRKAERSEIQKLFGLNELLVIEIEQAKQKVDDCQKENSLKIRQVTQKMQYFEREQERGRHQFFGLENRVSEQIMQRSSQIDRILDILEAKQSNKEQHQYLYDTNIESLDKRVRKLQSDEDLFVKELVTRVSVLELKENHITRAVKDVDILRTETQAMKLDFMELFHKISEVHPNVRQFCQSTVSALRDQLEDIFNKNMELAHQEILQKVINITEDLTSFQQANQLLSPLQEKNRQLQLLQSEMMRKIEYLDKKQVQLEDSIEQEIEKNQERLASLRKQFKSYINHKQFKQLTSKFTTIEEIKQIGKQIDKKMESEMGKFLIEQEKINQVLCSENIMAKWFWCSAGLKGGNLVAWDRQIVNTFPENFKWTKSQPSILICKGGYYRLEMGFYSKKKPTVQVIVNGQTIVSAVNSSSYVVHHSSGKLKDVSNSEIAGLTYVDYFLLPDQSRIVTSYVGEFTGEGFLAVHRI